nr:amino acid ABC transporter permease [Aureimonas sp. D3]
MEEQVSRFVAGSYLQPLPPPAAEGGWTGRIRKSFFATPLDAVLSLLSALLIGYIAVGLYQWGIANAVFTGENRSACLGDSVGACWAFIGARFQQFIFGLYPVEERWRVVLVFALLVVLLVPLAIPRAPFKRLNASLMFFVFPLVTIVLLTGGRFAMTGSSIALAFALAAAVTLFLCVGISSRAGSYGLTKVAVGLTVFGLLAAFMAPYLNFDRFSVLTFRFDTLSFIALVASLLAITLSFVTALATLEEKSGALRLVYPTLAALFFVATLTTDFGLAPVPTNLWGGLLVTLVVALTGIALSFPLGILLALGRQSSMPAVRLLSVVFIEFWRGVPLITVLFMATFMLPLLLPSGVSLNQLLRVLVGVSLFAAAYMAEVIRGGLQAIPKGQYEGADAMALTYWQKMRMIILPQALTLVIPGIVNTFIGLFKDTSLVSIIGLADLLGAVRRGFNDPAWITPTTPATGLVFAAFSFWIFCFGMSRYSIFMERRLSRGHKR